MGKVKKQTMQVLKGSNNKRMLIEVHPDVLAAMEFAEKKHGRVFPEDAGGSYYVRANPQLHVEKFSVRPLAEKRLAEAKKECKIIR